MTLFLGQRASLSNAFESVIKILPEMINSTVSVDRIRELVELPKEVHNEEAVQELISCSKDGFTVELKDVCYAYKDSDRVLDSCNLIAAPNEMIALTGASGEGKTTLLRIFLGLIHPDSGTALLHASNGHSVPFSVDQDNFSLMFHKEIPYYREPLQKIFVSSKKMRQMMKW